MNCSGRTAIVAEGLGGIGYATCNSLLAKGVKNLAIFDIAESLDLIKELSEKYSSANVKFWKVDVTKTEEIDACFEAVQKDFGSIDILVTSVGIVDELNPKRCIEIILIGIINLNYAAIDYMSISKGGKGGIVANVASIAGIEPFPLAVVYSSSKFGVVGLTRSLGNDLYLNTTGIRFIAICPGLTRTSMTVTFPGSPIHDVKEIHKNSAFQTAEDCGGHLVMAIEKNKNGSIWMIADGKMSEITSPCYYDIPVNI